MVARRCVQLTSQLTMAPHVRLCRTVPASRLVSLAMTTNEYGRCAAVPITPSVVRGGRRSGADYPKTLLLGSPYRPRMIVLQAYDNPGLYFCSACAFHWTSSLTELVSISTPLPLFSVPRLPVVLGTTVEDLTKRPFRCSVGRAQTLVWFDMHPHSRTVHLLCYPTSLAHFSSLVTPIIPLNRW